MPFWLKPFGSGLWPVFFLCKVKTSVQFTVWILRDLLFVWFHLLTLSCARPSHLVGVASGVGGGLTSVAIFPKEGKGITLCHSGGNQSLVAAVGPTNASLKGALTSHPFVLVIRILLLLSNYWFFAGTVEIIYIYFFWQEQQYSKQLMMSIWCSHETWVMMYTSYRRHFW